MSKIRLNCKRCGQFFWVYPRRKDTAVYCSNSCRSNLVTFNCDECGREKTMAKSNYEGSENHFCSLKCSNVYKGKQRIKSRITVMCGAPNCTEEHEVLESRFNHVDNIFCDRDCFDVFSKREQELYPNTKHLRNRVRSKIGTRDLSDFYIKKLIRSSVDIKTEDIPQDLIEAKRIQVIAQRQANNNLKITPELCQNAKLLSTT